MKIKSLKLKDLKLITLEVLEDERGYFTESFNFKKFKSEISIRNFVQDNESLSQYGVFRGLHFQKPPYAQSKYIRVISGKVLDVVVDLRIDSFSFGHFLSIELNSNKKQILYVPKGFAHGFLVLSKEAIFSYKVDNYYNASSEIILDYNDEKLNIKWPIPLKNIIISKKDKAGINFRELPMFTESEWNNF